MGLTRFHRPSTLRMRSSEGVRWVVVSSEFKHEAVKLVLEHNRSATAIARALGMSPPALSNRIYPETRKSANRRASRVNFLPKASRAAKLDIVTARVYMPAWCVPIYRSGRFLLGRSLT